MVGGGNRKDEQLVISNNNVFAALGTLRKKKKSDKGKSTEGSSSKNVKKQADKESEAVFWAPAPLTVKSWADVDDEDDDDYYATTAPPQAVWGADSAANEQHDKPKETVTLDVEV